MTWLMILQFLIIQSVFFGIIIWIIKKVNFDSTQGAVNRLNKETEDVRGKQKELNEKIKEANEELAKRKKEAEDLVVKMKAEAEDKAKEEREKLLNKARAESEQILVKAQRSKDDMRKVVQKETEMKMAEYTAQILNSIFSAKTRDALHETLILDFLEKLEKIDMSVVTQQVDSAELIVNCTIPDKLKDKINGVLKERLK